MIRARSAAAAPLPANATPDVLASGEAGAAAAGAGIIAAGAAGEPLLEAPDEGVEAAEEEVDADAAAAAAAAGAGAASGKIPQHKSLFSLPLRIPFISGHASSSAAAVAPPLGPPKPPLTIRMCDNHYPFSMDTLKELQSALSQPAGAAASAAQHASSAGPLAAAALGPPVLPHGPPAAPSSGAAAAAAAATGASLSMASPLLSVMPLVVLEMVKRPAGAAAGAKCTTTGRGVQQPQTGSACAANAPAGGTGGHHSRNASHVSQVRLWFAYQRCYANLQLTACGFPDLVVCAGLARQWVPACLCLEHADGALQLSLPLPQVLLTCIFSAADVGQL